MTPPPIGRAEGCLGPYAVALAQITDAAEGVMGHYLPQLLPTAPAPPPAPATPVSPPALPASHEAPPIPVRP